MSRYLTKSASLEKFAPPVEGEKRTAFLKFKPASAAEIKAIGDDLPDGYVAGWASTDDMDSYRHRVMGGAFQDAITKRGLVGPKGIKLLLDHDWKKVGGVIKKLEYRGPRLWIEAQLNLNVSYARDAYEAAKMAGGLSFSVGFMLEKYGVEGSEETGEWLRIDKGDLYEVSVVPFPANEEAGMTFIKSQTKANTPSWRVGAARNLPINMSRSWDGDAARSRIFAAAGFDGDNPDPAMARRAFLVYDSANPTLRGGYKLPFADIVGGRLTAIASGIRAAASRLPQTDGLSDEVAASARRVIDAYETRMEELSATPDDMDLATVAEFEKLLVSEGIAKNRNEANRITQVVKANPALFHKGRADPASPPAPSPQPPVLAVEKIKAFGSALDKMRKVLDGLDRQ